jgi:hypothetical protein
MQRALLHWLQHAMELALLRPKRRSLLQTMQREKELWQDLAVRLWLRRWSRQGVRPREPSRGWGRGKGEVAGIKLKVRKLGEKRAWREGSNNGDLGRQHGWDADRHVPERGQQAKPAGRAKQGGKENPESRTQRTEYGALGERGDARREPEGRSQESMLS